MFTFLNPAQKKAKRQFLAKVRNGEYQLINLRCQCAGVENDELIATKDRYGFSLKTVLCMNCGLMRSNPYYSDETLQKFYENEYRDLYHQDGQTVEQFFEGQ